MSMHFFTSKLADSPKWRESPKVCHFCDFGTIPLPRKWIILSHKMTLVLPVLLVLAANFSWRNGHPLVAKNASLPEHASSRSSWRGLARGWQAYLSSLKRRCVCDVFLFRSCARADTID